MQKSLFVDYYKKKNYEQAKIEEAVSAVMDLEEFCSDQEPAQNLDEMSVEMLEDYMDVLIDEDENDLDTLISIAVYFYITNNHKLYIQMMKVLGGLGVMENIRARVELLESPEMASKIFDELDEIPLGTSPAQMPEYTIQVMESLEKHLPEARLQVVLAGNNHHIPREAMLGEKELYEKANTLDQYLKERHERKVAELQKHCDEKKIWFEQTITQDIVDYVKSNQEILSAVRVGDKLYVTKIPYDTQAYLKEKDPKKKAYHACHCTFARESVLNDVQTISENWCYCSGGYEKFPFEVILDQELKVTVLSSALKHDAVCRFEISLEGISYKK